MEWRYLRLGAGPAVRLLDYEQGDGKCGCLYGRSGSSTVPGLAGDLTLVIRRKQAYAQAAFMGRWFRPHGIPEHRTTPEIPLGGWTPYASFGLGFAF